MRVNGKSMQTIWFDNELNAVQILDQTMLPFKIQLKQLNTLEDSIYAIKNMLVRGAPLIGVTAAYGMYLAVKKNPSLEHLNKSGQQLIESRPTAVNLKWAVNKIINKAKDVEEVNRVDTILNLANEMNLFGVPTSFFINRKGDLIGYFQGDMEWDNDTVIEFINYLIKT